jgi:hypothetical protein
VRFAYSAYLDVTSAGKVFAKLVEGERHDTICAVKGLLDAVAVVNVDINVQHALVSSVKGGGEYGSQGGGGAAFWGLSGETEPGTENVVEHALEQLKDGQDNVVDVAKAGRLALLGVVQATGPVDADVGLPTVELGSAGYEKDKEGVRGGRGVCI